MDSCRVSDHSRLIYRLCVLRKGRGVDTYYIYLDFEVISREFDHPLLAQDSALNSLISDTIRKHGRPLRSHPDIGAAATPIHG